LRLRDRCALLALQNALASLASLRLLQICGLWHQPSSTAWDEDDRPPSRPQFLVALPIPPAGQTRPLGCPRRHSIHKMPNLCTECARPALPACLAIVQHLSVQARPRLVLWCPRSPLAATVFAAMGNTKTHTTAPDARKMHRKRIQCPSTWRSTHLGRMYHHGAPGQASER
jgi:hypothetical protein